MNIYEKLSEVQSKLKVGKENYNSFGKYKYRSSGDILEAVKPLLKEQKLNLRLTDDLVQIGNRYYIKAMAVLIDTEKPTESIVVESFAREQEDKKGSDASQITGAASTYARKYALNGLFDIDDSTDDPDKTNKHGKDDENIDDLKPADKIDPEMLISEAQQRIICELAPIELVKKVLVSKGYTKSGEIKEKDFTKMCNEVKKEMAKEGIK